MIAAPPVRLWVFSSANTATRDFRSSAAAVAAASHAATGGQGGSPAIAVTATPASTAGALASEVTMWTSRGAAMVSPARASSIRAHSFAMVQVGNTNASA